MNLQRYFKSIIAILAIFPIIGYGQSCHDVTIVGTSDVHGAYFDFNYLKYQPTKGGLSRVMTLLRQLRDNHGENRVVYIDNGDILQGQPTSYYYNFIDTTSTHLAANVLNYMGCDVGNIGNHDIETGHPTYDRWIADCNHPVLGANIINKNHKLPYLRPYQMLEKDGMKIAVLGMITPAIPCWLPENQWSGLEFEDMKQSATKWIDYIKRIEKPDVIIGVFHSGQGGSSVNGILDNCSDIVAEDVAGFDMILCGHDHKKSCRKVANKITGDSVLILNPGSAAYEAAIANIKLEKDADGKIVSKSIDGYLQKMASYDSDPQMLKYFANEIKAVEDFENEIVGSLNKTLDSKDVLDGPSEFVELIHRIQLQVAPKAQLSITSPLSLNSVIKKGNITVRDLFNLYVYENLLYTMELTGQEIKDHLEMSYDNWINRNGPFYNYDSAYGINYNVHRNNAKDDRIEILGFADGTPFSLYATYKVAINSYRGNGGGNLLTDGAGIPKEQLLNRVIDSTDRDLRYYMIEFFRANPSLTPTCTENWKFIE